MTRSGAMGGARWFRVAVWWFAVASSVAFLYFFSTNRGWLPGATGPTHSLLLIGSSTAILWSLLALGRSDRLAGGLSVLALVLLIGALVSFVQNY
jgi:peptidoglycan/LPS O-acetylase OafA/YrhL